MISKKLDLKDNFTIILFATLPIASILGNFFLNLYLLCIFLLFIHNIFKTKNFTWFKDTVFKILLIFYLYICTNSLINYYIYPEYGLDGITRSILFLKFLILFPAIPLLIDKKKILEKIFKFWLFLIFIIIIDIFFEKYNGSNLLGFKSLDETRITSFFYDENIVGAFLFSFGFITTIFFLQNEIIKKKYNYSKYIISTNFVKYSYHWGKVSFFKVNSTFFVNFLLYRLKKIIFKKDLFTYIHIHLRNIIIFNFSKCS